MISTHDTNILPGTSTLKRHQCASHPSGQPTIESAMGSATHDPNAKASQLHKDLITRHCVDFICKDLRPFNSVAGAGFMGFVQCLLKIQHESPKLLSAKSLVPHPTTVSRSVHSRAESLRSSLSASLQDAFRISRVSFTSDMWTDEYKQRPFITITAHWIDSMWTLQSRIISTEEFDATQKKTGANIRSSISAILSSYDITPEQISRSVFTTDCGSNMILALREDDRLDCIAHILNTILRNTFDEKKNCPPSVTRLLDAVKGLVRFMKKSSFHNQLSKSLIQSCDTRWNSVYHMLQSVLDRFDEVQTLILKQAAAEIRRVAAIDISLLKELVPFLQV